MKQVLLTDPFTGIDFTAIRYDDKTIIAIHPLTGETIRLPYDFESNAFMLPAHVMKHIDAVTLTEAAEELNVSLQRVSTACKTGKIAMKTLPNGSKMILRDDLRNYKKNRKNGRPRKDINND